MKLRHDSIFHVFRPNEARSDNWVKFIVGYLFWQSCQDFTKYDQDICSKFLIP